jgi:hypothetical protein
LNPIIFILLLFVIPSIFKSLELYGSGWRFKEIVVLWNHMLLFSGITTKELYEKNYLQKDERQSVSE